MIFSKHQLYSVCKKTDDFCQTELFWMRFSFSFYELMPGYQPIIKKWKDRQKKLFQFRCVILQTLTIGISTNFAKSKKIRVQSQVKRYLQTSIRA